MPGAEKKKREMIQLWGVAAGGTIQQDHRAGYYWRGSFDHPPTVQAGGGRISALMSSFMTDEHWFRP